MEELLVNYLRFIEEEMDSEKKYDPDTVISKQFDEILDEMDFKIATIKFEIDALVEIPRSPSNNNMTLRELVTRISSLPKINKAEAPAFMKKKKGELARIAREMAADLQNMFG
ncbi:MAG: hypothetical protein EOM80_14025 [Erysipelotrichia bacterium]|nr:hypothetical protein [Candidatus Riflebacteria bacterium]NCB39878.1 hypothetical protein [Erysipelotrichia bacterium]